MKISHTLINQSKIIRKEFRFFDWLLKHRETGVAPTCRFARAIRANKKDHLMPVASSSKRDWNNWLSLRNANETILHDFESTWEEYVVFLRLFAGNDVAFLGEEGELFVQERLFA